MTIQPASLRQRFRDSQPARRMGRFIILVGSASLLLTAILAAQDPAIPATLAAQLPPTPGVNPGLPLVPPSSVPVPFGEALGADPLIKRLTDRLEALEKAVKPQDSRIPPVVVAAPGQPAAPAGGGNMPKPPLVITDDQQGAASVLLLPELATLQASWIGLSPPSPTEASAEASLTNKIAGWNNERRSRVTIIDTLESRIKANEIVISQSSRKLDDNTLALSNAKFNISWAKTNNDSNALALWTKTQEKLKADRFSLIAVVKQRQTESIAQVRRASALKQEISLRAHDVDLANSIISLIKAAAPIPGPPLP